MNRMIKGKKNMLRNIPKILPPDLVKYMMEMGHADYLVIADAGFPGTAHSKRMIRMDSAEIPNYWCLSFLSFHWTILLTIPCG